MKRKPTAKWNAEIKLNDPNEERDKNDGTLIYAERQIQANSLVFQ